MKKGFTLAELIGVVVLLGVLLIIIVPVVNKSLKDGKQKLLNDQITSIKTSLASWEKPKLNETYYLTLSQLKREELVDISIKNPLIGDYFANDMVLKIINNENIISYEVLTDSGNCKDEYENIPKFDLKKDIEYIEINSTYNDLVPTAKNNNGDLLTVTSSGNVDTSKIGSYYITYNASFNGVCNSVIKTVIVRDTIAPTIKFKNDLVINKNDINSYDFLSDVTVTDNSGTNPNVVVKNNLLMVSGIQSIEYTATDNSGNVTTITRKVVVK